MTGIIGITICVNYGDILLHTLPVNHGMFDTLFVVTTSSDSETIQACKGYDNVVVSFYDGFFKNGAKFNKSGAIYELQKQIHGTHANDWIVILDADILVPSDVQELVKEGLGRLDKQGIWSFPRIDFTTPQNYVRGVASIYDAFMAGYFHMYFHKEMYYQEFSPDASWCDFVFKDRFPTKEHIHSAYVHHLGEDGINWKGRVGASWSGLASMEGERSAPMERSVQSERNARRDLIYYVVGGDAEYAELLRFSINTIRCFPENDAYDILVMCDPEYASRLYDLPVRFHHTWKNDGPVQASMRKCEIFNYRYIGCYDKVLYLDADTVVTGSLAPLFDCVTADDKLYVVREMDARHDQAYYHCRDDPYVADELEEMYASNIYPFNAGQFAFKPSAEMHGHLERIAQMCKKTYDSNVHFYEQGFMNPYFNRKRLVTYELEGYVKLFANRSIDRAKCIHHFCDVGVHYVQKLERMRKWHEAFWGEMAVEMHESRDLIANAVSIPPGACIAEIGSFRGDYAEVLLKVLAPSKLHIIDPWRGMIPSGDQDGNHVKRYYGNQLYRQVVQRFRKNRCVTIHRAFSQDVQLPDACLDLLYIDGDHSYEGVLRDLDLAMRWVKFGGWICGHDYDVNPEKTANTYDFGVKRAVQEFCRQHGLRVWSLMNDGCMSFVIRK